MAMLGLHLMKEVPFRDVYIHTLVRDPQGQKMSKSKGNVIDPLGVMERFGTDAFRFTLAILAVPGVHDIRIADERVEAHRNFANKLWNAARLVLSNLDGYQGGDDVAPAGLPGRWIESRLQATMTSVREALDAYRFSDAAAAIYQFLWNDFCDWYLEIAKISLYQVADPAERHRVQHALVTVLERTLRLLHPFMPFITEELWQRVPHEGESIMVAPYPKATAAPDVAAEREMGMVMQVITAIRNIRGEMRVSPAQTLTVTVKAAAGDGALLRAHGTLVEALARARVTVDPGATRPPGASALGVVGQSEIYVELEGLVDLAAERQRLEKEIKRTAEAITFTRAKLSRPDFTERAPAEIVDKERDKLAEQEALHAKLVASLSWVG
jgi:valyl-tRNA synthetase